MSKDNPLSVENNVDLFNLYAEDPENDFLPATGPLLADSPGAETAENGQ